MLGTLLVALGFATVLGGIAKVFIDTEINWGLLALEAIAGTSLVFILSFITVLFERTEKINAIPFGITIGLISGLALAFTLGFGGVLSFPIMLAVIFLLIGIAVGIYQVVAVGEVLELTESLPIALGTGICTGIALRYIEGIATGIAIGLGMFFGGKYASRQIPEKEIRQKLAKRLEERL
ncbi:MAG: hypothetical protein KatS3mg057_0911 [Herpetosiphonaceae bacterium]|nr:MAG: hypothetical protein KatS3mg057_0911 [Herpetosiphonaceae bacterium]